jgi:adenosylmethionine-8-amino-7-oxononanoate aminotransferase
MSPDGGAATASRVLPRQAGFDYPSVVGAAGLWLELADGRRILDACSGGAMTTCLGHGNEAVVAVAAAQGEELSYCYSHHFTNKPQESLARRLVEEVAPAMNRVRFATGGSEANETALRLLRSYHVERGDTDRWKVISPAQAYHGSLTGTLALTGRESLRRNWNPYLVAHPHLGPAAWREDPTGGAALAELDRILDEAGPETVAAYFCEPVSAAALPAYSPPEGFWLGLAERRAEHGFLIVCDEIVSGIGRTGSWFASDRLPFTPDVITAGKGLGGGFAPISAVLCTAAVYDAIDQGSGDFDHGHTWDGAPLPCAVAEAVIDQIVAGDLVARVATAGGPFRDLLEAAIGDLPIVREVRGSGFLVGIELDPAATSGDVEQAIVEAGLRHDLLLAATSTVADGFVGDQVALAPSFTSTDAELDLIVERSAAALADLQAVLQMGATG